MDCTTNVSSSDERRVLEAGVEIAVRPLLGRLRPSADCRRGAPAKSCVGPLQRLHFGPGWLRRPGAPAAAGDPDVAVESRVRAAGPQAFERIDDERQRLEVEVDPLDGLGGRQLVDRRDGENRLALVERLVGQRAFGAASRSGRSSAVRIAFTPGIASAARGVDAPHARVRHRAEQQLAEQHAVGAKVLGVLRAAGDLGDEVRRACSSGRRVFGQPSAAPRATFCPGIRWDVDTHLTPI